MKKNAWDRYWERSVQLGSMFAVRKPFTQVFRKLIGNFFARFSKEFRRKTNRSSGIFVSSA